MALPHPLPDPLAELLAGRLRVIADPTRIKLLDRLQHGEPTVQELADMLDATHQNVSKHLGLLHRAGMVRRRKAGTCVHYAIADPTTFAVVDQVSAALARQAGQLSELIRVGATASTSRATAGGPTRPPTRIAG